MQMNKSCIKRLGVAFASVAIGTIMGFSTYGVVNELPVTSVRGVECFYYDVRPKESIYQVAHKLGVTREQITEHNPSAADGLKPKMRLFFPVSDFDREPGTRKAVYAAAAGVKTHVVKKGETIYGIAHQYGMSPDYLAELNPHVADGLKIGDELRITEECDDASQPEAAAGEAMLKRWQDMADADGFVHYEIKPGDTLFSVANRHGLTLEVVFEANPSLDPMNYKAGQEILLPVGEPKPSVPHDDGGLTAMEPKAEAEAGEDVTALVADTTSVEDGIRQETMAVAVMLPFMLNEEPQSRTTQLYTEFFRGMLMAADTLRNAPGAKVNFEFFDTAASLDTVNALMRRPDMGIFDLVIAPDNPAQLAAVVDGVDPETLVFNIFAVKDEDYKNHRNMIQTNIPHDAMYAHAIDAFMQKYEGVLPVFINRNAGMADKEPFVKLLKERLTADGRDFRELTYDITLSDEELAAFDPDMTPLVFVPNSGSKTEFARFVGALTSLRNRAVGIDRVKLFGYPEWVTFRGDSFDELCNLDATIYSRFLSTDNKPDLQKLKNRYKEIYGVEMFDAVPTQGVLGYDMGMFVINGLRNQVETGVFPSEFDGVQSRLKLGWSGATSVDEETGDVMSNGGLVNEALYIINYRPGGIVEWEQ